MVEVEHKWLLCNEGALVLEFLDWPVGEAVNERELTRWIAYQLGEVRRPSGWKFSIPLERMVLEQTTVVYCTVRGDERLDSPIDFTFLEGGGMSERPQTLRHLVFVTVFEGRYAVMGAMMAASFFEIVENDSFVTYADIMVRETPRMLDGLELFDEVDYFFVFDKIHERSPPLIQATCDALLYKFYHMMKEAKVPEVDADLQPYVFQYMLFAASATDALADTFIAYERGRFEKRLLRLAHNPYLQLELCRKWLRIDWRPVRVADLATSHSEPMRKETELDDLHMTSRSHFPSALSNPSHYVPVRLHHYMGAHVHLKCTVCQAKECIARPPFHEGSVLLPLQFLPFAGVEALGMAMRKWIQATRREYHTYDALTVWMQTQAVENWRPWTRDFVHSEVEVFGWAREMTKTLTLNPLDKTSTDGVKEHVRDALQTRDNFSLLFDRDPIILEKVIVGKIWAAQCGLLQDFPAVEVKTGRRKAHPRREYDPRPGVNTLPILDRGAYSEIMTYEELLLYTAVYWPPCMHRMISEAVGRAHLRHKPRLMLGRFLLSYHSPYVAADAKRIWELIWTATDVYKANYPTSASFWKGQYGLCFTDFMKSPFEEQRLWPYCRSMAAKDLCPFASEEMKDIEDLNERLQTKCTQGPLAERREKLKKRPNRGGWRLYSPVSFLKNLHTY
jgi:hypothetical protein